MSQKLLFSATLALGLFMSAEAQTAKGKIVLTQGLQLEEVTTMKAVSSMEMMGNKMETIMESTSTNNIAVKENTPANYLISNTYKRLQLNMSVMGQERKIDTDNKEDMAGEGGEMGKLINKSQDIVIDKNGKILELKKSGDAESDAMQQILGSQVGLIVNSPFAAFHSIGGGKAVKVNDTWVEEINTDQVKSTTTYTLKSLKGNEASVSFTGTGTTKAKVEKEGMEIVMDMTNKTSGDIVLDISSGIIKTRTGKIDATGTTEVMGQKIPIIVNTVSNSTFTKK